MRSNTPSKGKQAFNFKLAPAKVSAPRSCISTWRVPTSSIATAATRWTNFIREAKQASAAQGMVCPNEPHAVRIEGSFHGVVSCSGQQSMSCTHSLSATSSEQRPLKQHRLFALVCAQARSQVRGTTLRPNLSDPFSGGSEIVGVRG